MFTGNWIFLNYPKSAEILTFIANQLSNVKKIINEGINERNKPAFPFNSNAAFFFKSPCFLNNNMDLLLPRLPYRKITLSKPNLSKIYSIIS